MSEAGAQRWNDTGPGLVASASSAHCVLRVAAHHTPDVVHGCEDRFGGRPHRGAGTVRLTIPPPRRAMISVPPMGAQRPPSPAPDLGREPST